MNTVKGGALYDTAMIICKGVRKYDSQGGGGGVNTFYDTVMVIKGGGGH